MKLGDKQYFWCHEDVITEFYNAISSFIPEWTFSEIYKTRAGDSSNSLRIVDAAEWTTIIRALNKLYDLSLNKWFQIGIETTQKLELQPIKHMVPRLNIDEYFESIPLLFQIYCNYAHVSTNKVAAGRYCVRIEEHPKYLDIASGDVSFCQLGMLLGPLYSRKLNLTYRPLLCQARLEDVIEEVYHSSRFSVVQRNEALMVNGEVVALKEIYEDGQDSFPVFKVCRSICDGRRIVIPKGWIFGAPYSVFIVDVESEPLLQRLKRKWKGLLEYGHEARSLIKNATRISIYQTADQWPSRKEVEDEMSFVTTITRNKLTLREEEVVELLAKGLTRRMICDQLNISIATVKRHTESIYSKLKVHSRVELVHRLKTGISQSEGSPNI